jgi:mRNA interferase RelE/StbE
MVEFWPESGRNNLVAYRIVFTENAIEDFSALDARERARGRDAVRAHWAHEPVKESQSRIKRLRELNHPQYRLRVGEIRVFYDVIEADVVILAIMPKERTTQWLEEQGEK